MKKRNFLLIIAGLSVTFAVGIFANSQERASQIRSKASLVQTSGPPRRTSDLYTNPQLVEIAGYDGDAMEPCITLDGKFLFFNDSNEKPDTRLHYANRLSNLQFQYRGAVPGTRNTPANAAPSWSDREMVPTIDSANEFFFCTPRSYGKDRKTVYMGKWNGERVTDIVPVDGDISPVDKPVAPNHFWINMDTGVSPDGQLLVVSRTEHGGNSHVLSSDLMLDERTGPHAFRVSPSSEQFLANVNSRDLEYAPAITADKLELYFTRTLSPDRIANGSSTNPITRIMVASRKTVNDPFGPPEELAACQGFVEAPSLTLDNRELFFHKKDGNRFRICCATRRSR